MLSMQEFTLYWKNTEINIPYFYVRVKADGKRENAIKINYVIRSSLPLPAEDYNHVMTAAEGTVRKYCGLADFQKVSGNLPNYVITPIRELILDIHNKKGPLSLDSITIPDTLGNEDLLSDKNV